jgi:hypothetical protein
VQRLLAAEEVELEDPVEIDLRHPLHPASVEKVAELGCLWRRFLRDCEFVAGEVDAPGDIQEEVRVTFLAPEFEKEVPILELVDIVKASTYKGGLEFFYDSEEIQRCQAKLHSRHPRSKHPTGRCTI